MSIQNLEMIAHREIVERWHSRIDALALVAAIVIVLAALVASA